jgi:hypothetical protein
MLLNRVDWKLLLYIILYIVLQRSTNPPDIATKRHYAVPVYKKKIILRCKHFIYHSRIR